MLSSIPKAARWPYPRFDSDELIDAATITVPSFSTIGLAPNFLGDDNRFYIPGLPFKALNNSLQLEQLGATPGASYICPYAVGESLLGLDAMAGTGWYSNNGGLTMTERPIPGSYKYHVGGLIKFKNLLLTKDQAVTYGQWQERQSAQNLNGAATTRNTGSVPASSVTTPDTWAKNANCIIGAPNGSYPTAAYVCWSFPTFVRYEINGVQNSTFAYLGNNVFLTVQRQLLRFIYIPATQGQPVVLAEIPQDTAVKLAHVCDKLFIVRNAGEVAVTDIETFTENAAATQAHATTYVQKVLAALAAPATVLMATGGYIIFATKWNYNRFVVGHYTSLTVRVWEVKSRKPSDTFTFKAGTTGSVAMGSVGFSLQTPGYGYNQPHGTLIKPFTDGPAVALCADWTQNAGNSNYNGFGMIFAITKAELLVKYAAIKANGRTFSFDRLEGLELLANSMPDGSTGVRCCWWYGLAKFVAGQTYTVELIPR